MTNLETVVDERGETALLLDEPIIDLTVVDQDFERLARAASTTTLPSDAVRTDVAETAAVPTAANRLDDLASTKRTGIDSARIIDLVLGIPIFVVALPILAAMAAAVKLDSRGQVLFRQERIGRDGVRFKCLKIRTMRPDAEERLQEMLTANPDLEAEFLATRKLAVDPRVTRVGRFLRPTGLDELPQLWNVLRGDMSLVGPRPRAVSEFEICGGFAAGILGVRPGLTGPWQVSGRNEITDEQREAIELNYAETRTFAGDVRIVCRTVFLLLTLRLRGGS